MANTVFAIRSSLTSSDTTLSKITRDPLLDGIANSGVRFIADAAFGFSYPAGPLSGRAPPVAPADGAVIGDVSETANSIFTVASGQTIGYAGGGFDFSSATTLRSALIIPASVAADISAAFNSNSQYFLASVYVKLPTLANVSTANTQGSLLTFTSANGAAHPGLIDVLVTGGATPSINFIRELSASTTETTPLAVNSADWGQLAQLSFWRNGTEQGYSLRTVRARTTTKTVPGAVNSNNFASSIGLCGVSGGFWFPSSDATFTTNPIRNFKLYRVFIENLARSGRTPLTVLEADWLRVVARGVFS